ncbi:hypothetical protein AOXY_G20099 [Acipenser oxyrinchus oxyrinchus]|uniref:Uncharacterized protein n=1 Tax=Acipenser oxyrinchus oxyrinchus TaxID=40147 RepID=A0AAD8CL67_ACIOX|nr:hypothetical protein AOXY_G36572 [Acipenser oxyrinchus oxyrinchus]KAK1152077.1 hypothetical protein AOXY_G31666 [Acipenser oxyrinchus oxyrinchus]KAK1161170.1 hypothetical protein AOXY_G20099 [Acipenser oxyrinchus oxyrinchus]
MVKTKPVQHKPVKCVYVNHFGKHSSGDVIQFEDGTRPRKNLPERLLRVWGLLPALALKSELMSRIAADRTSMPNKKNNKALQIKIGKKIKQTTRESFTKQKDIRISPKRKTLRDAPKHDGAKRFKTSMSTQENIDMTTNNINIGQRRMTTQKKQDNGTKQNGEGRSDSDDNSEMDRGVFTFSFPGAVTPVNKSAVKQGVLKVISKMVEENEMLRRRFMTNSQQSQTGKCLP